MLPILYIYTVIKNLKIKLKIKNIIYKTNPKPKGSEIFPIQFSTISYARDVESPPDSKLSIFISLN